MEAKDALVTIQIIQPLAQMEHAQAFLAIAADRGLTPFVEIYPIFAVKKEKRGDEWVATGIKSMTVKEHYNIAGRWAQQCGGYSTPIRKTQEVTISVQEYKKTVQKKGVQATVGVLTNRDYAALVNLAQQIPGFDFVTERAGFLKEGSAFVPYDHTCPSGKDHKWVALKRATEEALLMAFGREPSMARQLYTEAMAALPMEAKREAAAALYGVTEQRREALPSPVEIITEPRPVEEIPEPDRKLTLSEAEEMTTKKGTRFADLTISQLETVWVASSTTKREKEAAKMLLEELNRMDDSETSDNEELTDADPEL